MNKSLNPIEIQQIAQCPINVLKYSELCQFKNISELFPKPCKCVLLLFETKFNNGHWCCLIKHKNSIEFFDPYAFLPDDELKFTNEKFREQNNMNIPYLTYLLLTSKLPIEYNDYQFQRFAKGVNTCGRWCGYRMQHHTMSIDDFIDFFKQFQYKKRLDYVIVDLTKEV
jgi:hypothetical protein